MKKILFTILLINSAFLLNAQTLNFIRSAGSASGSLADGNATVTDATGNIYVVGNFSGDALFGSITLTSAGSTDFFVAKYNSSGTLLWAKRGGGTSNDDGRKIAVNGSSVYITGSFRKTANFNTPSVFGSNEIVEDVINPNSNSSTTDLFIAKYDDAGNFIWARRAGGNIFGDEVGTGIAASGSSVYLTGSFWWTGNFNTPSSPGSNELVNGGGFLAKYNDDGVFQWVKRSAQPSDVAVSGSSIYVTGSFFGTVNFNTPSSPGSNEVTSDNDTYDIFIAKFNDAGAVQWVNRAGGNGGDNGSGIAVYNSSVYITGDFQNTASFNSSSSNGNDHLNAGGSQSNVFIAKYNDAGVFQWATDGGGTSEASSALGMDIAVTATAVYISGSFREVIKFGNNAILISPDGYDMFAAKYTDAGVFQWAKRAGGANINFESVDGIAVSGSSVYLTGQFNGMINFNTPSAGGSNELISLGGADLFLSKFDDAGNYQWARQAGGELGGSGTDFCNGSATDAQGNVYITGNFEGTFTIGNTTLTSDGSADIYIAKYNSSGVLQWAKRAGGLSYEVGNGIAVAGSSVYITGFFSDKINFNTPSAPGSNEITSDGTQWDIFIAKYDNNGVLQWVRRAGDKYNDAGYGIAAEGSSVYITGYFEYTCDFNTSGNNGSFKINSGSGGTDIFVAKYNDAGEIQWARRAGGKSSLERGTDIAVSNSSVYVTGYFSETATFTNASGASSGNNVVSIDAFSLSITFDVDIFIAKYNADGNVQWARRVGGPGTEIINKGSIAASGSSVYVGGFISGTGNFNTPSVIGSNELTNSGFLAKYNDAGVFQWARHSPTPTDIKVSGSSVYTTGGFSGTVNFNTPSTPGSNEIVSASGFSDIFLSKFNDAGVFQWATRAGGAGSDFGSGVAISGNSIYACGSFSETANFNNPSSSGSNELVSLGSLDVFLAKYTDNQVVPTVTSRSILNPEINADQSFRIIVYPNPSASNFSVIAYGENNYSIKIYDVAGKLIETKTSLAPGITNHIGERLIAGAYIIEINNGKEKKIMKLIKQ